MQPTDERPTRQGGLAPLGLVRGGDSPSARLRNMCALSDQLAQQVSLDDVAAGRLQSYAAFSDSELNDPEWRAREEGTTRESAR